MPLAAPPRSCALLPPLLALGVLSSLSLFALHCTRRLSSAPLVQRAAALCLLYTLALALLALPAPFAPAFSPCAAPTARSTAETSAGLAGCAARGEEGDDGIGSRMVRGRELSEKWEEAEGGCEGMGRKGGAWTGEADEGSAVERAMEEGEEWMEGGWIGGRARVGGSQILAARAVIDGAVTA
ncbi:hypothetical protein CLOM_g422 [Closterium sp. NIES-68]|nr:hypothetical protein CLOM_g422 [Closterium sp. NIES-68]